MTKKPFLISVDTEGDGLWSWRPGDEIRTENSLYLARFQELCDRYEFKPTYLTNWEMANDRRYKEFALDTLSRRACEIGMHLHAWNTPPAADLMTPRLDDPGQDYLIEYDESAMEAKIASTTEAIENNLGVRPITHRAGRWAMDSRYFRLLAKFGYRCDCSMTPLIDWSKCKGASEGSCGSNYTDCNPRAHLVDCGGHGGIVEVPLTTMSYNVFIKPDYVTPRLLAREARRLVERRPIQCRPTGSNLCQMLRVARNAAEGGSEYLMFMIHSSELMPGGSPAFPTENSIEALYKSIDELFRWIARYFSGETIGAFALSKEEQCTRD